MSFNPEIHTGALRLGAGETCMGCGHNMKPITKRYALRNGACITDFPANHCPQCNHTVFSSHALALKESAGVRPEAYKMYTWEDYCKFVLREPSILETALMDQIALA